MNSRRFDRVCLSAHLVALFAASGISWAQPATIGGLASRSYYKESSEIITNPERGFYHHPGDCNKHTFKPEILSTLRDENISLVLCIFYLRDAATEQGYTESDLPKGLIDFFDLQAKTVREAGLKMILRFAYSDKTHIDPVLGKTAEDASPSWVQRHQEQLKPVLQRNRDVIAFVESGFVGAWGEGYHTRHFGNRGMISNMDWENRRKVVEGLLDGLPGRMANVRTPVMKQRITGSTAAVLGSEAYGNDLKARIGHHNDCFLGKNRDQGTYTSGGELAEREYLRRDTAYVVMGGETCEVNPPRSECADGKPPAELAQHHYSYLNWTRSKSVLDSWESGHCMTEVKQRLGYRLSLIWSQFPVSVVVGSPLSLEFSIQNTGWAAPVNYRPVYLVLRNRATRATTKLQLAADPRRWQPGISKVTGRVGIPLLLRSGDYDVLLSLPEPSRTLPGRPIPPGSLSLKPEYAIQLANAGTWEQDTGFNRLLHTLRVKPQVFTTR